ncbi:MAG: DUF2914 domain-containing protein [Desulfobacterales bacterium]|nr:MAG: DUF2914 domain-containing protein [Desulfobacterales bacterium]
MTKRYGCFIQVALLLYGVSIFAVPAFSQEKKDITSLPTEKLTLGHAVMCESIKDFMPENAAVVFSITIGKVSCFTAFDVVPEKTFIYHKWYHKDKPSTEKRLTLQPPSWASYSSIQLRETDKGPWRVEIYDQEGNLLHTLRFSITD